MALLDQIESDLTASMKSGQTDRTAVLRLLKNSLKNEQIKLGHDLSDEEVLKVLQREAKQRRDSVEAYQQGGREELAASESAELEIIKDYLPTQIDETELTKIVDAVIADTGAKSIAEIGIVIGAVRDKVGSQADGAEIARIARQRLV